MLVELLSKVKAYRAQQTTELSDGYRQLIVALADGENIDAEQVAVALDAAGKSEDQLQSDVELLLQRREWARQIQAAGDAETTMRKAQAEIDKLVRDRDSYCAKINSKIDQLQASKADAERRAHGVHSARESLSGSCYDPVVLSREAEVSARLSDLVQQERDITRAIRQGEAMVDAIHRNIAGHERDYKAGFTPKDRQAAGVLIENAKTSLRNHEASNRRMKTQAAEIRSEITKLQDEMERLASQRLIP
jgi:uncharacterized protein YfcZ (UPF0381/DUF406 family)